MGVFEDLKIPKLYRSYEEDTVRDILDLINRMSGGTEKRTLNHQIFKSLLANIYERNWTFLWCENQRKDIWSLTKLKQIVSRVVSFF